MIRGDPAVEEVFAWKVGETLVEKNEPKVSLPAATTSTYSTICYCAIQLAHNQYPMCFVSLVTLASWIWSPSCYRTY